MSTTTSGTSPAADGRTGRVQDTGSRAVGRGLIAVALALIPAGCRRDEPPTRLESPNIVLITLDTTRADHLGCYGYFRDTSPVLDALAAQSILFDRCLAPISVTLPSHVSLLTSTDPTEHGVVANVGQGGLAFVASPALKLVTQFAREAGYSTAGFVSAAPLKQHGGLRESFDTWSEPEPRERRAGETNTEVFRWLDGKPSTPMFLWVHYYDPHSPYEPPPETKRYEADEALLASLRARDIPDVAVMPGGAALRCEVMHGLYDGEIRYMDEQIGRLLDRLRAREDWARTVVVVVGDHGEGLAQHGELAHGSVWDEQLHVPLMMRIPGEAARREGMVMSMVDVFPTLLGRTSRKGFEGFLSQALGHDVLAAGFTARPVLGQMTGRKRPDKPFPTYCVTTERWKFTHEVGGADSLFDLSSDPHELKNVVAEHAEPARQLRDYLLQTIAAQQARAATYQSGRGGTPATLDPRVLEQLRTLGYLGDDEDEHAGAEAPPADPAPAGSANDNSGG